MFCPNCGTKNDDAAVFCEGCGTSLAELKEAPATTQENEVNNETSVNAESNAQDTAASEQQASAEQVQVNEQPVYQAQPEQTAQPVYQEQPAQPVYQQQPSQPVYQSQPAQQSQPIYQGTQPTNIPKLSINKKMIQMIIAIAAAVLVVIIGLVTFISVGKNKADYKKQAEKYFNAVNECDWKKVYSLVDMPKSEFLTADQLSLAMKDAKPLEISKYKVSNSTYDKDSITQTVFIDYIQKGSGTTGYANVDMIKLDKEKTMIFFDTYKVSAKNLIAKDIKITVYKDATVTMDGIAVDSKFKSTNASDQKTLENYDVYIIPYMFQGMHKIKVTSAMMEDYEEDISVYDEKNITYKSTKVKAETLSQADTVAQDVYKKVIASAVAKDDFSKVKDSFVNDSNFTSSIQSNYEKVRGNLTNSDGYGYKTLSLTSLKGKTDDYYTKIDANGVLTTKVELSVAYSGEYTSRTYSSSLRDYETTSKTKTGTTSATMYLRYENNAWKVYDVYFYSIY